MVTNHDYIWYWRISPTKWKMTTDEHEADVALLLGYHVVGEKIPINEFETELWLGMCTECQC